MSVTGFASWRRIPGSHHAKNPLPSNFGEGFTVDTRYLEGNGHLVNPAMRRGDVLMFLGAAVTHGAAPWRAPQPRRACLMNFWSRHIDLGAGAGGPRPEPVQRPLAPHPLRPRQ